MASKASSLKVPAIPVIVKKGSKLTILKKDLPKELIKRCVTVSAVTKDQPIYESVPGDFLRGEFPGLSLVSRFNVLTQTSSTVARFTSPDGSGNFIEKNSNEVVKIIGQNNYDTVFSALCSVISQELRIRALLALLTIENGNENSKKKKESAQTQKSFVDCASQTDETSKNILDHFKVRKRIRRQQFRPYIVRDESKKLKRVIIYPKPSTLIKSEKPEQCSASTYIANPTLDDKIDAKCDFDSDKKVETESLPELSACINEDSTFSDISIGNISLSSRDSVNIPQLLNNPTSLLNSVDSHTELNIIPLTMLDGSVIMVNAKPIDKFHWADPAILKNLSDADRNKLLYHQLIIHWKYCLERDEDGFLPIHQAVMASDAEWVARQCAALVNKYGSVDIPAEAAANMTPLHLAIRADDWQCAAVLLRYGADPRLADDAGRGALHAAAELAPRHLQALLLHCRENARAMLMEDEDLWRPDMEQQSDEQLARILLDHVCGMCDSQGYTPLMVAARAGNAEAVQLLVGASPRSVNQPTPNSGSTALYVAVEAACLQAANSKNQSKISPEYLKTISVLMEAGGDPARETHAGASVNQLLTDYNCIELSVLVANKLTTLNYCDTAHIEPGNINSLMLLKNSDGKVNLTEISARKTCNGNSEVKSEVNVSATPITPKPTGKNSSKIKIKNIQTIKVVGADLLAGDKLMSAVSVKPEQVIIKKIKPNLDVPKYVKIAPKSLTPLTLKNESIDGNPTPVKKQRKK